MVNRRKDSGARYNEFDKTRIALSQDGLFVEGDSLLLAEINFILRIAFRNCVCARGKWNARTRNI